MFEREVYEVYKAYKRVIALFLIVAAGACLPLAAMASPATPASSSDRAEPMSSTQHESPEGSMETALIAVKELFDIDDEIYTDFSYSSSSSGSGGDDDLAWSFYWSDSRTAYIFATATASGTILQYRKLSMEERSFGFAEIDQATAVSIADAFIRDAKPDSYSFYKAPASVAININSSEYNLNYYAEVNGYTFAAAQAAISINKFTGELTSYSTSNINPENFSFEDAASVISESDAVSGYAGKVGLSLEYMSHFDYESGRISVFPVYLLDPGGDKFISAVSGEVVMYVYDAGGDDGMAGFNSAASGAPQASMLADQSESEGGRSSLSPAEITALDRVRGFITGEQALQKLLETADLADMDVTAFSDRSISLNRDYMDRDSYFYDVMLYNFDEATMNDTDPAYVYGRVNAETGRVYSFSLHYISGSHYGEESGVSQQQAEESVRAFLESAARDELAKCVIEDSSSGLRNQTYLIRYTRYENDIPFSNNGIHVTFDPYLGRVTSYSLNWYENVTFPGVEGILSQQEALEAYVAQVGSRINYITTGGGNASLVYEFKNRTYIDPFTGKALDYNGAAWTDNIVIPEYGDVAGHWSEGIVTRLLDNGVFLWGGNFEPGRAMTELEFLRYILLLESYYSPVEPLSYLAMRGISIDIEADRILTRQEAARIIIEYLGYGKLGEQSEWFVYPFSDDIDEEYRGYVTICYMLGIVNGSNGRFDASGSITRAQAASILHNMILAKS